MDDPATNFGWILLDDEVASGSAKRETMISETLT
jgi:hypothetical protein